MLSSFQNKVVKNPDELCHASWPLVISFFAASWTIFLIFGGLFVELCYEVDSVGTKIIPGILFVTIVWLFGLFAIVAGCYEIYLKAFVIPHLIAKNEEQN